MRLVLTGVTSFTGMHFANALVQKGFEVYCPVRFGLDDYTDLKRSRLNSLSNKVQVIENLDYNTPAFIDLLNQLRPAVIGLHGAYVVDYRSRHFPAQEALRQNTANHKAVVSALSKWQGAIVYTSTIFEKLDNSTPSISPYGESKYLTWKHLLGYAQEYQVSLARFVVANPIGPLENPKLQAYLIKEWREGKPATLKHPHYVRDFVPVDFMAESYSQLCLRLANAQLDPSERIVCPSYYVLPILEFAQKLQFYIRTCTQWPCEIQTAEKPVYDEPMIVTCQAYPQTTVAFDETQFWLKYIPFLLNEA